MCRHGVFVVMPVFVWINACQYPPQYELKNRKIDACLAPFIYKLNQNQVTTLNSCCGHRQDWRYNIDGYEDLECQGSVIIDIASTRHADSLGYYVSVSDWLAEIILN